MDDSAVIRGLITRTLESDSGFKVVASCGNGEMALAALARNPVDVIVLDIEMPVMDGLTAIPKLLAIDATVRIVMASTLTMRNADISMKCLAAGASDYIPKPTSMRGVQESDDFKRELLDKVRSLADARRARSPMASTARVASPATPMGASAPVPAAAPAGGGKLWGSKKIVLREGAWQKPEIIAIGSSTGGPQALFEVCQHLKGVTQPIVITQHMPPTFTTILAEHISRQCGLECKEAIDGEVVQGGRVYLAPGDFHLTLLRDGVSIKTQLSKAPPENFCRPAVDPMLRSLIEIYGRKILVVILTGMGSDGCKGAEKVVAAGGQVLAQDEASSVVWGMPGAVATAGLCTAIMPLKDIGQHVRQIAQRVGG